MIGWLERRLTHRRAPLAVVALAVVLAAPSLNTGLVADDHLHEVMLRRPAPIAALGARGLDLFTFASGDPADAQALMDAGLYPWTVDPQVRLAFFRPLSALTHAADHVLWPGGGLGMHAHNLLWFALALLAAGALYRRLLGPGWVAVLALLLYAMDDAHGPAVGWIANRNAMIAVALGLPALALHDRWVRERWRPGAWLGPAVFALALLAGEAALALLAYLAAHALHVDRGRPLARAARLAPFAAVTIGWRIIYTQLGYGASGSGVYLDPAGDLASFAAAVPQRAPALLAGQVALPWSDFHALYGYLGPHMPAIMLAVAAVVVALFAAAVAPLWRRDHLVRFFATGMLLATLPICATFPADRLLWFVGIGAMGLVARLLADPGRRRIVAGLLVAIHLVLAAPLLALRSRSMTTVERPLARASDSLPADLAGKTVVLINPPSDFFAGYIMAMRASRRQPMPARLRWLAAGTSATTVERTGARTLRVRPAGGYLGAIPELMLRSPHRPLHSGDRVTLTGMTVEVTATLPDGRPAEAVFRFERDLDDAGYRFMRWGVTGFQPFTPPPLGASVSLPPSDFLKAVFAKD